MGGFLGNFGVRVLLAAAVLIGAGSLALFGWFLALGPLGVSDLGLPAPVLLACDALLCLAFFLQHSVMVRTGFRRRLKRIFPPHYYAAVYSLASGLVLIPFVLLWQESAVTLLELTGAWRWLWRILLLLGIVGFFWTGWSLHSFDPFGVKALRARLRRLSEPPPEFVVRGTYQWVRHPFYLCQLLMIWSYPTLTADRLLFNVLFTSWIVFGAHLEERDLLAVFGEPYADYRRRVPMLLPLPRRAPPPAPAQ